MTVRLKVLLISFISVMAIIIFTFIIFNFVILGYIFGLEEQNIKNSYNVLDSILDREQYYLKRTALDWAHWDDTYNFMLGQKEDYIAVNLQDTTLKQLKLNIMLFTDAKGNIIHSNIDNLNDEENEQLLNKILIKSSNLNNLMDFSNNNEVKSGVLLVSGKLFIITICPITSSDENALSNGRLIIGRYADETLMDYIKKVTNNKVEFQENTRINKNNQSLDISRNISSIRADKQIEDINKNKSITTTIVMDRNAYDAGIHYFKIFIVLYIILLIIILLIGGVVVNKYILKRLRTLYEFIESIASTKDTSSRIVLSGSDEIYQIANSTNKMLYELDSAYKDMKVMDERFRTIMEATNDGYLDFNVTTKELYISPHWKQYIGYREQNGVNLFKEYISRINSKFLGELKDKLNDFMIGKYDKFEEEYEIINAEVNLIWVLHRGKVAKRDEKGKPVRIVSTISDINSRKRHEEEVLFLSYSDKLTGLRNRAYVEMKFEELDKDNNIKYSIIVADLNGLKFINDTFGHKEGDKVINEVGKILKEGCGEDNVIARWAGDSFVVLIFNKDYPYVSSLVKNIKRQCEKAGEFNCSISLALGSAEKKDNLSAEEVMNLAEERVLRSKLTEIKSTRNAAIKSLESTLYEKHSETEEHTQRIKKLSIKLGERLLLPEEKLDELHLLSLLHDIGKIGIPEQILVKPTKLTEEEWKIMKSHTEIGYRIAKSTPELSHIADEILCHHEKFDGTGYPKSLKGEEIPLLSRIINIVDSFDVMTHSRSYKGASTIEYAIDELKRCSGTQFDPIIVDVFLNLLVEEKIIS